VIVVNTCGFIADAVEESLTVALQLKEEYPDSVLVFAGCVPLRFGTELVQSELPEFDYVVPGFNMPSAFLNIKAATDFCSDVSLCVRFHS